jgi:stress-induced morphogen
MRSSFQLPHQSPPSSSSKKSRSVTDNNSNNAPFPTIESLQQYESYLKQLLLSSETLKPVHVEISNVSCWFYMRRKLKAKKHSMIQIKPNSLNPSIFEGYIYDLKRREEDLEIVPKKTLISSGEDRFQVMKGCEIAMKERDKQRIILEESSLYDRKALALTTYLKLTIVSDAFHRLTTIERNQVVYDALLDKIGQSVDPNLSSLPPGRELNGSNVYLCPPSQIKGFCYPLGKQVCSSLKIFSFLKNRESVGLDLSHPSTVFLITALTPSQWRPNEYKPLISERLGATHLGMPSILEVNTATKPKAQKERVKKLTSLPDKGLSSSHQQDHHISSSKIPSSAGLSDSLGVDPSISGVKYKKLGGIYGHFFQDLSPEIRELVMLKYENNRELIKDESRVIPSSKPSILLDPTQVEAERKLQELANLANSAVSLHQSSSGNNSSNVSVTNKDPQDDVPPSAGDNNSITKEGSLTASEGTKKEKTTTTKKKKEPVSAAVKWKGSKTRNTGGIEGLSDIGTKNPLEMREEVLISARRIELLAIRLQRIRRCNLFFRTIKVFWHREYSAITIQRLIRGRFGRKYYFLFQRLQPLAAMKIQRLYREIVSYRIITCWQQLVYRMTRRILPKIKRFIRNCFLSWIYRRSFSVIKIQRLVRRQLAKIGFYRYYGTSYFLAIGGLFHISVILIQRHIRGYLGRKFYAVYLNNYLKRYIDIPAAIRIQRIYRGRLAKKLLIFLRYQRKLQLRLQHFIKRFIHRKWDKQVTYQRKLKYSAIRIQRIYRGYYDRKLYKLKYYFFFYFHIYIPMAIKVQSYIRCFLAICKVSFLKRRYHAAKKIQSSYRTYQTYLKQQEFRRRLLEAKRVRYVVIIQKNIRRFLIFKKYQRWITIQRGKELLAAKMILRGWKVYQINKKYSLLLEDFRIQREQSLLLKYETFKEKIQKDLKEITIDIHFLSKSMERYKIRLKELNQFLSQVAFRLTKINKEMSLLQMEDFEKGWAEALGQEYEYLTHQELMAREELRLIRHKIYRLEEELFSLYVEQEENEMELDRMDQLMISTMEKSRLRQILAAERKSDNALWKNLYREKVHWKITSNRTKKVLNNRIFYQNLLKDVSYWFLLF